MSWMGEIQRTVDESLYEGAQEGKLEEVRGGRGGFPNRTLRHSHAN
jgi:hypothetical protein